MKKEIESSAHSLELGDQKLAKAIEDIGEIALDRKLDPFPTVFNVVPASNIYEVAAYLIPGRFSHWTFGKAYYHEKTMYDHGLSKIYELVVNTNPSQAYLLENNSHVQNMLVAAHVLGHTDFFKNNVAFANTDRKMDETAHLHADRIREYEFEHGPLEVEKFLDAALSIEHNIDTNYQREWSASDYLAEARDNFKERQDAKKRRVSDYDDLFSSKDKDKKGEKLEKMPFPVGEEEDLLGFIATFSQKPLEPWQIDVLQIVRNEAYYFLPQMKTKIMNEGWAVFQHMGIGHELFERDKITEGEAMEWDVCHAGVVQPNPHHINPYFLGWKVLEDIDRLYKGIPHPDGKEEKDWQGQIRKPSFFEGREEYDVYWIRENIPSDQAFLRLYLTNNIIEDMAMHTFGLHGQDWLRESYDPQVVKSQLISNLNYLPTIKVVEGGGDYQGNRELYLRHAWEGLDLDTPWAEKTLPNINFLWGKPVHLEQMKDGDKLLLSCKDEKSVAWQVLEKAPVIAPVRPPITKHHP